MWLVAELIRIHDSIMNQINVFGIILENHLSLVFADIAISLSQTDATTMVIY